MLNIKFSIIILLFVQRCTKFNKKIVRIALLISINPSYLHFNNF